MPEYKFNVATVIVFCLRGNSKETSKQFVRAVRVFVCVLVPIEFKMGISSVFCEIVFIWLPEDLTNN